MFIFRFKITFEDNDSFYREVDFGSNHTFKDFHDFIVINLGLDNTINAFFYLCDHKYRKLQEIVLYADQPENDQEPGEEVDEENENSGKQAKPLFMNDNRLSDLIDDPHQRLIYIFDKSKNWTFFIELLKILPGSDQGDLPKSVKKGGGIPRELKPLKVEPGAEDESVDIADESEEDEDQFTDEIDNLNIRFGDDADNPGDNSIDPDGVDDDDKL